jgi:hypothetical protein
MGTNQTINVVLTGFLPSRTQSDFNLVATMPSPVTFRDRTSVNVSLEIVALSALHASSCIERSCSRFSMQTVVPAQAMPPSDVGITTRIVISARSGDTVSMAFTLDSANQPVLTSISPSGGILLSDRATTTPITLFVRFAPEAFCATTVGCNVVLGGLSASVVSVALANGIRSVTAMPVPPSVGGLRQGTLSSGLCVCVCVCVCFSIFSVFLLHVT